MKRNLLLLAAAPVLGLVFVCFLPLAGFVVTLWAIASRIHSQSVTRNATLRKQIG